MNQAIRNRARVHGGVLTGGFTLALTALFVALSVALVLLGGGVACFCVDTLQTIYCKA